MCDQQQWDASSHEELLFACFFTIFYTSSLTTFDISAQFQLSMIWTACLLSLQFVSSLSFVLPLYFLFQLTYLLPFRASFSGFREISLTCKKKKVSHWEPISPPRHHSRGFACWLLLAKGTLLYNCLWRCSCRTRIVRASEPITSVRICLANHIWFLFFYFFSCVLWFKFCARREWIADVRWLWWWILLIFGANWNRF